MLLQKLGSDELKWEEKLFSDEPLYYGDILST